MRYLIALTALFAGPVLAAGTTANLSWTISQADMTYLDGTPYAAADIKEFEVSWNPNPPATPLIVAGNLRATTIPVLCGGRVFSVRIVMSATAKYPNSKAEPKLSNDYDSGVACVPKPVSGVSAS